MVAPVREQVWSARNSREKYFYFFCPGAATHMRSMNSVHLYRAACQARGLADPSNHAFDAFARL